MIWAVIDGGIVTNTIIAGPDFVATIQAQHQAVIQIDAMVPMPAINWTWDGTNFFPPVPVPLTAAQIQQGNIAFAESLVTSFALSEQGRGLTAAQRLTLAKGILNFMALAQMGDLDGMIAALNAITPDGTIITAAGLASLVSQIQTYQTTTGQT
jgi:hypothetical protein